MVNDKVILLAKSKSDSFLIDKIKNFFNEPVTECEMKFMTSSQDSNTKPALEIEFESFNIARGACDVKLEIHQSPTQFFTKDVTEMVQNEETKLSCRLVKSFCIHVAKNWPHFFGGCPFLTSYILVNTERKNFKKFSC